MQHLNSNARSYWAKENDIVCTYPNNIMGIPAIAALIKNEIPGAYSHFDDNPRDQE